MRLIHASPEGYIGRGGTDVLGGARQRYPSVRLRLPPPLNRGGAKEYPIANTQYPMSNRG